MNRAYYSAGIEAFLKSSESVILARLNKRTNHEVEEATRVTWREQTKILKEALAAYGGRGKVYFEYAIPRLSSRIDAVVLIDHIVFVLEFKTRRQKRAINQARDYARELKNLHEASRVPVFIAPIVVGPMIKGGISFASKMDGDGLFLPPLVCDPQTLGNALDYVLRHNKGKKIDPTVWERGGYRPTPAIVEEERKAYESYAGLQIFRNGAAAENLTKISRNIAGVIQLCKKESRKALCFATGAPKEEKAAVGLDIATGIVNGKNEPQGVYLLAPRWLVKQRGDLFKSKTFTQSVLYFSDDCLADKRAPVENVILLEEARRMRGRKEMFEFMKRKKGVGDFNMSEAEFLISCMDRRDDWAVIVCFIGDEREIGKRYVDIRGWIDALTKKFPHWYVYTPSCLIGSEYDTGLALAQFSNERKVVNDGLHWGAE